MSRPSVARRGARIPHRTRLGKRRGAQLALLIETLRRLTSDSWSVAELAEDLGVHRRTVWRVLHALRERTPLECERDEGHASYYRLPRRWWEP